MKHLAQLKLHAFLSLRQMTLILEITYLRITTVTSKEGSALEIDAENCLSEYSLVSNVVGRHLDGTSDSFDAALGVASDFILLAPYFRKSKYFRSKR